MGIRTGNRVFLDHPQTAAPTPPALLTRFADQLRNDRSTWLNPTRCDRLGTTLAAIVAADDDDDFGLFPELDTPELAANGLAMFSSINHRFWTRSDTDELLPVYYEVAGEQVKGSSYLVRCFDEMATADPDFFTTENLNNFTREQFNRLMGDGVMPDADHRFAVMKDLLDRTIRAFGKSVDDLWHDDAGRTIEGLHGILNGTLGFHDELQKKTQMLVKLLHYAGYWTAQDTENIVPPCDYHLMNAALKTGIVELSDRQLRRKLSDREPLTPGEAQAIRLRCLEAYDHIAKASDIDPYRLDDVLWWESRTRCQDPDPDCGGCPLAGCCHSKETGDELLHSFPLVYTDAY